MTAKTSPKTLWWRRGRCVSQLEAVGAGRTGAVGGRMLAAQGEQLDIRTETYPRASLAALTKRPRKRLDP